MAVIFIPHVKRIWTLRWGLVFAILLLRNGREEIKTAINQIGEMVLVLKPVWLKSHHLTSQHRVLFEVEMYYIKVQRKEVDCGVGFLSPCAIPTLPYTCTRTLNGLWTWPSTVILSFTCLKDTGHVSGSVLGTGKRKKTGQSPRLSISTPEDTKRRTGDIKWQTQHEPRQFQTLDCYCRTEGCSQTVWRRPAQIWFAYLS